MDIKSLQTKAKEKIQDDGVIALLSDGFPWIHSQFKKQLKFYYRRYINPLIYYETRTDNDERWSIINEHIDENDRILLDIGCAEGYFTAKSADKGLFSIGIENRVESLKHGRKKWGFKSNLGFANMNVSPENIDSLPPADVTLLLTVHHHWVKHYDWDNAEQMLKNLASKSNKIFYEPPGTEALPSRDTELEPESSIDHYTELLNSIFGNSVRIIEATMVPYRGERRADPLFVLDTSQYEDYIETDSGCNPSKVHE